MSETTLGGRVAVVTGANRGIGKAIAIALANAGARVALVARDREQLDATASEIMAQGGEARPFRADVTSEEQIAALQRDVAEAFGPADILINNAGINVRKNLLDFTLDEWNSVVTTNLTSAFLMCRAFVPHMRGHGYGRVINIASTMSHVSLPQRAAYSSSKAALLGLTRALALEVASEQITVVAISPGPFATEMNTPLLENPELTAFFLSRVALGRWGKVDEVGKLAVFLCSEGAAFITGTDILIDGGWCAQ
jgi:NAD(P)-dependent dehydrogenase (short-subunit alcohol dehydrogenase family)